MKLQRVIVVVTAFVLVFFLYLIRYHHNVMPKIPHTSIKPVDVSLIISATQIFYIAVVACGQRLQEALVLIKSALLFNNYKDILHFLVIADDQLQSSFNETLNEWRSQRNDFNFTLYPLKFPANGEWKTFFKPCAAQRLFLPSFLQSIESLLYVDTDILFLSPVRDIWKFFSRFNFTQIAALAPEHEDPNIGWYNRYARHPYYGPLGVNSGVMLMNLSRMREFKWEEHVLSIQKEYNQRLIYVDQDIINIIFHYHPEKLFVMPYDYNYRPDHCMYMRIFNASTDGIKIMHGNRGYFHSNNQPLFRAAFEAVESFQLGANPYDGFLAPLKEAMQNPIVTKSNCGKVKSQVLHLANKLFSN